VPEGTSEQRNYIPTSYRHRRADDQGHTGLLRGSRTCIVQNGFYAESGRRVFQRHTCSQRPVSDGKHKYLDVHSKIFL
jgi:hypothetical protein